MHFASAAPEAPAALVLKPAPQQQRNAATLFNGEILDARTLAKITSGWSRGEQIDLIKKIRADDSSSLDVLRAEAGKNYAWAQRNLGSIYKKSTLVTPDPIQSINWYKLAAEQGDVSSQYELAWIYFLGEDVPQDFAQARAWLSRAAGLGFGGAQSKLGEMYRDGQGGKVDMGAAFDLFSKAAEREEGAAYVNLAAAYANGQGVPADLAKAYSWLQIALQSAGQGKFAAELNGYIATLKPLLTSAQIDEARQLAEAWQKKHPIVVHAFPPMTIGPEFDASKPCRPPTYPDAAGGRKDKGAVGLRLWVGADGKVERSEVQHSSGFPVLDRATVDAISICTFTPALRFGNPVPGVKEVNFTWTGK